MRSNASCPIERFGERQKFRLVFNAVDLVQNGDPRHAGRFQALHDLRRIVIQFGHRIDDEQHGVGIFQSAPRRIDHRPVEPSLRIENSGRVDEHDLALALRSRCP